MFRLCGVMALPVRLSEAPVPALPPYNQHLRQTTPPTIHAPSSFPLRYLNILVLSEIYQWSILKGLSLITLYIGKVSSDSSVVNNEFLVYWSDYSYVVTNSSMYVIHTLREFWCRALLPGVVTMSHQLGYSIYNISLCWTVRLVHHYNSPGSPDSQAARWWKWQEVVEWAVAAKSVDDNVEIREVNIYNFTSSGFWDLKYNANSSVRALSLEGLVDKSLWTVLAVVQCFAWESSSGLRHQL